jgi:hypothetical protein
LSTTALSPQRRGDGRTDEQVLDDLRAAAARWPDGRLSLKRYEQTKPDGAITVSRVLQRYGSWRTACEAAGIEPGGSGRGSYSRAFSEEDCWAAVQDYLADPEAVGSYADFTRWTMTHAVPSAQTVRNTLGAWNDVKAKALGL